MYQGYLTMKSKVKNQEFTSPKLEDLVIIPEDMWIKNQEGISNRTKKQNTDVKGSTVSHVLASGLVFCGYCKEKMHVWANHKSYTTKAEEKKKYVQYYYKCKSSYVKNLKECTGQSAYSANRIDVALEEETLEFLREISKQKLTDDFKSKLKSNNIVLQQQKDEKSKLLANKQKQIVTLKKEIPNAMLGESVFSINELKESLSLVQKDTDELVMELNKIEESLSKAKISLNEYTGLDENLSSWEERYNQADFTEKKAMINQLIEKIFIYKDEIEIEYKITLKTFKENSTANFNLGRSGKQENFGSKMIPIGSALGSGPRGRGFNSRYSDHNRSKGFEIFALAFLYMNTTCHEGDSKKQIVINI
jgi:site-specific DNA recombinase